LLMPMDASHSRLQAATHHILDAKDKYKVCNFLH